MTSDAPRYCPACDRAFLDGEPVLRCPECGLQQHPTCWVTNQGCLTEGHEDVNPVAEAYERPPITGAVPASAPADDDDEPGPAVEDESGDDAAPVIGTAPGYQRPMSPPRPAQQPRQPADMVAGPPARGARAAPPVQSRRAPNPGELGKSSPGILRFWYVPVGIVLAVGIAVAVVLAVDRFAGDDAAVAPDETPTATPGPPETPAPGGTPTPPPEPTPTAPPGPGDSPFSVGQTVVIQGTGNCLNIRSEAGLDTAVVDCLDDGLTLQLLEGPVAADDLTWWRIQGPASTGWAADLYFVAQQ